MKKMSFEKIVVIVIVAVLVVAGVVLFAMSKHDTNADVNPQAPENEAVLLEPNPATDESTEAPPEENENDAQTELLVGVNMESGGGEILTDENGYYSEEPIGEEPELEKPVEPEVTPEPEFIEGENPEVNAPKPGNSYSSFSEIDTSKLDFGDKVVVNGTTYCWFGEIAGTDNGFMELTSNNGQHIDADVEITGNIIGY